MTVIRKGQTITGSDNPSTGALMMLPIDGAA
jgi:hypothetical protein